jgi:hypothetical protein
LGVSPVEELTLRIAPFASDGLRELAIPASTGDLRISCRATDGHHVVTTSPLERIALEVVGPDAPVLQHGSA